MTDATLLDRPQADQPVQATAGCDECAGTGGWFRYAPGAEETSAGALYLSCLGCRGSGRLALAHD